jgi:hypothetical protein
MTTLVGMGLPTQYTEASIPAKPLLCMLNRGGFFLAPGVSR